MFQLTANKDIFESLEKPEVAFLGQMKSELE